MSLDNLTDSMLDIHASLSLKAQGMPAIYELKGMAPAPNQTYFHLGVYAAIDSQAGSLCLAAFPRKRMSQNWNRDSNMNPSERIWNFKDFLKGEYEKVLTEIFGEEEYEKLLKFLKEHLEVPEENDTSA
jgi:hypothetical protein